MHSRFAANPSSRPGSGNAKPHIVFGVGYKIPPNNVLYDSDGNRIVHLEPDLYEAYVKAGRSLSNPELRRRFYNQPAVMCTEEEYDAFNVTGKQMALHHNEDRIVGQILQSSVHGNEVLLTASVTDPEIARKIEALGERAARAFSIGMIVKLDGSRVVSKEFREFSIVDEPFYPGCYTRVVAGKDDEKIEGEELVGVYLGAGLEDCAAQEGTEGMSGDHQTTAPIPSTAAETTNNAAQEDVNMPEGGQQQTNDANEERDETMETPSSSHQGEDDSAKLKRENESMRKQLAILKKDSEHYVKQQEQKATDLMRTMAEGADKNSLINNRDGFNKLGERVTEMARMDPSAFEAFAAMIRSKQEASPLPAAPVAAATPSPAPQQQQQPQGGLPKTATSAPRQQSTAAAPQQQQPRPTNTARDVRNGPALNESGKVVTPASKKRDFFGQIWESGASKTTTTTTSSLDSPHQTQEHESPAKKVAPSSMQSGGGGSTSDFLKSYGVDVPLTAGLFAPDSESGVVFLSPALAAVCRNVSASIARTVGMAAINRNNKSAFVDPGDSRRSSFQQTGPDSVRVTCSKYGDADVPSSGLPRGAFPYIEQGVRGYTRHSGETEFYQKTRSDKDELLYGFRLKGNATTIDYSNPAARFMDKDHLAAAQDVKVGALLDFDKSLNVFRLADGSLLQRQRELVEAGEAALVDQNETVAVTASKTPFVLSGTNVPGFLHPEGQSMEKLIEFAKTLPYFESKTDAEMFTIAMLYRDADLNWKRTGETEVY